MYKKCFLILIVFVLGISYFVTKFGFAQEPKERYPTKNIRELWQVCATSFRNKNPGVGPNIYFPVCDCYVDHIRYNYTPQEVSGFMTQDEYRKLSQDLRDVCNPKKQLEENFTNWIKKPDADRTPTSGLIFTSG